MLEKKRLSAAEIEAQVALELPERELPALVNVIIGDVTVQVPVGIAANICDVNAAVLANQLDAGDATCTATAESIASNGPGRR